MKKLVVSCLFISILFLCVSALRPQTQAETIYSTSERFAKSDVIEKINQNVVAIAVYYYMDEEEYNKRISTMNTKDRIIWGSIRDFQIVIPLKDVISNQNQLIKCIAYIGAGVILKDNYILTVSHLFKNDENTLGTDIYIVKPGLDHFAKAEIVAISNSEEFYDDYAIIRSKEDLKTSGLKIAKPDSLKKGDKVICVGSTAGVAFFMRFSYITTFHQFFRTDEEERLRLSFWADFPFWCIIEGAPGDSGGPILNEKGEIVTIMYLGTSFYTISIVLSNPTSFIYDFLKKNKLEHLAR